MFLEANDVEGFYFKYPYACILFLNLIKPVYLYKY